MNNRNVTNFYIYGNCVDSGNRNFDIQHITEIHHFSDRLIALPSSIELNAVINLNYPHPTHAHSAHSQINCKQCTRLVNSRQHVIRMSAGEIYWIFPFAVENGKQEQRSWKFVSEVFFLPFSLQRNFVSCGSKFSQLKFLVLIHTKENCQNSFFQSENWPKWIAVEIEFRVAWKSFSFKESHEILLCIITVCVVEQQHLLNPWVCDCESV